MKFPAGSNGGTISNPRNQGFIRDLMAFYGAIEITTSSGHGILLSDNGRFVSAYFQDGDQVFRGTAALSHMSLDPDSNDTSRFFDLHVYTPLEFDRAVRISREENLLLAEDSPVSPKETPPADDRSIVRPEFLDESKLQKILSQPGVIAVSAFFEGFPVQSIGDADFEHIAVSAEDFARAGTKIAHEMGIGNLDQLILETPSNKVIIAPCGDLYLCIFTRADAQLGLIRVVLKSIQQEIAG